MANKDIKSWLERVVVGLNLCPFAALPIKQGRVRIVSADGSKEEYLFETLHSELRLLQETPASELETTIIVIESGLTNFDDYLGMLDLANHYIADQGLEGVFQIASFHPEYQFEGTSQSDRENYTNRSPLPLFHLLREESLDKALDSYPNADLIPERNIQKMNELSDQDFESLFSQHE